MVADQFVVANGIRLHCREWGGRPKPAVLLLHGFSAHARTWDAVASALADRYRVVALDLRGHGESQWTPDYSLDALDEDVIAFAHAVNLGRFAVVGHALGGELARRITALHPAVVAELVIAEAFTWAAGPAGARRRTRAQPPAAFPPDLVSDPGEPARFLHERMPHIAQVDLRGWVERYVRPTTDGRWTWGHDPAFGPAVARSRPRDDALRAWTDLRAVACPALLVRGAESEPSGADAVSAAARAMTNARVIELAGVGHMAYLEDPASFAAALRGFL